MREIGPETIRSWLGVDKHGENWRREAWLRYRDHPICRAAYGHLSDDEFVVAMNRIAEMRMKGIEEGEDA